MYKKIAILLIIGYVASAIQISDPQIVGDKCDDLLAELQKIVDRAIDKAREDVTNFELVIDQTGIEMLNEATADLGVIQNKFRNVIDDLSAVAKRAGVNIDDCLGEDVDNLLNLPTVAVNEVFACKQNYIFQAFDSLYDALNKIQELADGAFNIKKDVEDCKKSKKSTVCLAKLIVKIEEEKIRLPREIVRDVEFVIHLVKNTLPILKKCGSNAVDVCDAQGKELLTKIAVCVTRKIIHH